MPVAVYIVVINGIWTRSSLFHPVRAFQVPMVATPAAADASPLGGLQVYKTAVRGRLGLIALQIDPIRLTWTRSSVDRSCIDKLRLRLFLSYYKSGMLMADKTRNLRDTAMAKRAGLDFGRLSVFSQHHDFAFQVCEQLTHC